MEQTRFDDYVETMDIILAKVKNDFNEQRQADDKVKCIEYVITISPSDISLVRKTEKVTYQDVRIPIQWDEEVKTSHLGMIRLTKK